MTIATALNARSVRRSGGPARVVERLLRGAGLGGLVDRDVRFTGVPTLHRRRTRVQEEGMFAIGDAAGFVEPITGEGMSWALASGAAVVPCVERLLADGIRSGGWNRTWRRLMRRRQLRCALVGGSIRHPDLIAALLLGSRLLPRLRGPLLSGMPGGADSIRTGETA